MNLSFQGIHENFLLMFILDALIKNGTKHIVMVDILVGCQFPYPFVMADSDEKLDLQQFLEQKPEVYIVNSTSKGIDFFLRKIASSFNYNVNANWIIFDNNDSLDHTDIFRRYFIKNVNLISRIKQLSKKGSGSSSNEVQESEIFNSTYEVKKIASPDSLEMWRKKGFTICFIDETVPPYSFYTVCPNCTRNHGLGFDTADIVLQTLNISRIQRMVYRYNLSSASLKHWLTSGMCDMVLTPLIIDGLLDFILPVNEDELIWFVPTPSKVPKWKYITRVFSLKIWLIWMFTISATALFWFIGRIIRLKKFHHFEYSHLSNNVSKKMCIFIIHKILFTFQLFLEQGSVTNIKNVSQIVFMTTVIVTTLAFNMIYKTGFTSLLLGPEFSENRIESLEDIADQGLSVSFAEWRLGAFEGTPTRVKNYFKAHNTECETISYCLARMREKKDLALLMSVENLRYDYENFLDENGRCVIQPIYPRFVKPMYGSTLLKGNPMVEIMFQYNILLRDHGFVALILSRYNRNHIVVEVAEDKQLSVEHFKGAFLILFSGILFSLLTFGLECIIVYMKERTAVENIG